MPPLRIYYGVFSIISYMELETYKKAADDDCVEAEIVSGPGAGSEARGGRRERPGSYAPPGPQPANIPFYGLFQRVKTLFTTAMLLISFALIITGLILTSTIIGAIIGVPLMILGGILLWILFKLLTFGQKSSPIIFRRF